MNPDSGAVAKFEKKSDAKAAGYTIPLTKKEASLTSHMNRKQRRAWASQQRKAK
jgi:hypothetical protein